MVATNKNVKKATRGQDSLLRVVGYYDQYDLRKIIAREKFLHSIATEHRMKSMDVVVYTNKKLNRFRLVLKIGNFVVNCVPEISEEDQWSLYLKINDSLAKMAANDDLYVRLKKTGRTVMGEEITS